MRWSESFPGPSEVSNTSANDMPPKTPPVGSRALQRRPTHHDPAPAGPRRSERPARLGTSAPAGLEATAGKRGHAQAATPKERPAHRAATRPQRWPSGAGRWRIARERVGRSLPPQDEVDADEDGGSVKLSAAIREVGRLFAGYLRRREEPSFEAALSDLRARPLSGIEEVAELKDWLEGGPSTRSAPLREMLDAFDTQLRQKGLDHDGSRPMTARTGTPRSTLWQTKT